MGYYEGLLRDLLLSVKWRRQRAPRNFLAHALTAQVARAQQLLSREDRAFDYWCPVPRDIWRLWRFGTPIGELLGQELGSRLSIPRLPPPRRRRRPPQAPLSASARRRNLRHVFQPHASWAKGSPREWWQKFRKQGSIEGRHILMVDDIATTGSTLNELGRILLDHGAARVTGCVVAVHSGSNGDANRATMTTEPPRNGD